MTIALRNITAGSLLLILAIAIACGDDEASVATPTPSPNASNTIAFQTFLSGHNSGLVGNETGRLQDRDPDSVGRTLDHPSERYLPDNSSAGLLL